MAVLSWLSFAGGLSLLKPSQQIKTSEAVVATNLLCADGAIRPVKGPDLETAASNYRSIYPFAYTGNEWTVGTLANRWWAEGIHDAERRLYWLDPTVVNPKKMKTTGLTANLGIEPPASPPTTNALPSHSATGKMIPPDTGWDYVFTYYSSIWDAESAPSTVLNVPWHLTTTFELMEDIDATNTTTVKVRKLGSGAPATDTPHLIDNEYILFTGTTVITADKEYLLTGVTRGALNTLKGSHHQGSVIRQSYSSIPIYTNASADTQVDKIRIYRALAGEFFLVSEVANGPGTTINPDTLTDELLAENDILTSDDNDPPDGVYGVAPEGFDGMAGAYNGMLFLWRDNILFWSKANQPDAWPIDFRREFPCATILNVVPFPERDFVVVISENGLSVIRGDTPDGFSFEDLVCTYPTTAWAARSAVRAQRGVLYYPNHAVGVVLFDGINALRVSYPSLGATNFFSAGSYAGTLKGVWHLDKYLLFNRTLPYCLVGDFRAGDQPAWTTLNVAATDVAVDSDELTGGTGCVVISRVGITGYTDGLYRFPEFDPGGAGSPLAWEWDTGLLEFDAPAEHKTIHTVSLDYTGSLTVEVLMDGARKLYRMLYSATRTTQRLRLTGSCFGYRGQIKLIGAGPTAGTVYGMEVEYTGPERDRP